MEIEDDKLGSNTEERNNTVFKVVHKTFKPDSFKPDIKKMSLIKGGIIPQGYYNRFIKKFIDLLKIDITKSELEASLKGDMGDDSSTSIYLDQNDGYFETKGNISNMNSSIVLNIFRAISNLVKSLATNKHVDKNATLSRFKDLLLIFKKLKNSSKSKVDEEGEANNIGSGGNGQINGKRRLPVILPNRSNQASNPNSQSFNPASFFGKKAEEAELIKDGNYKKEKLRKERLENDEKELRIKDLQNNLAYYKGDKDFKDIERSKAIAELKGTEAIQNKNIIDSEVGVLRNQLIKNLSQDSNNVYNKLIMQELMADTGVRNIEAVSKLKEAQDTADSKNIEAIKKADKGALDAELEFLKSQDARDVFLQQRQVNREREKQLIMTEMYKASNDRNIISATQSKNKMNEILTIDLYNPEEFEYNNADYLQKRDMGRRFILKEQSTGAINEGYKNQKNSMIAAQEHEAAKQISNLPKDKLQNVQDVMINNMLQTGGNTNVVRESKAAETVANELEDTGEKIKKSRGENRWNTLYESYIKDLEENNPTLHKQFTSNYGLVGFFKDLGNDVENFLKIASQDFKTDPVVGNIVTDDTDGSIKLRNYSISRLFPNITQNDFYKNKSQIRELAQDFMIEGIKAAHEQQTAAYVAKENADKIRDKTEKEKDDAIKEAIKNYDNENKEYYDSKEQQLAKSEKVSKDLLHITDLIIKNNLYLKSSAVNDDPTFMAYQKDKGYYEKKGQLMAEEFKDKEDMLKEKETALNFQKQIIKEQQASMQLLGNITQAVQDNKLTLNGDSIAFDPEYQAYRNDEELFKQREEKLMKEQEVYVSKARGMFDMSSKLATIMNKESELNSKIAVKEAELIAAQGLSKQFDAERANLNKYIDAMKIERNALESKNKMQIESIDNLNRSEKQNIEANHIRKMMELKASMQEKELALKQQEASREILDLKHQVQLLTENKKIIEEHNKLLEDKNETKRKYDEASLEAKAAQDRLQLNMEKNGFIMQQVASIKDGIEKEKKMKKELDDGIKKGIDEYKDQSVKKAQDELKAAEEKKKQESKILEERQNKEKSFIEREKALIENTERLKKENQQQTTRYFQSELEHAKENLKLLKTSIDIQTKNLLDLQREGIQVDPDQIREGQELSRKLDKQINPSNGYSEKMTRSMKLLESIIADNNNGGGGGDDDDDDDDKDEDGKPIKNRKKKKKDSKKKDAVNNNNNNSNDKKPPDDGGDNGGGDKPPGPGAGGSSNNGDNKDKPEGGGGDGNDSKKKDDKDKKPDDQKDKKKTFNEALFMTDTEGDVKQNNLTTTENKAKSNLIKMGESIINANNESKKQNTGFLGLFARAEKRKDLPKVPLFSSKDDDSKKEKKDEGDIEILKEKKDVPPNLLFIETTDDDGGGGNSTKINNTIIKPDVEKSKKSLDDIKLPEDEVKRLEDLVLPKFNISLDDKNYIKSTKPLEFESDVKKSEDRIADLIETVYEIHEKNKNEYSKTKMGKMDLEENEEIKKKMKKDNDKNRIVSYHHNKSTGQVKVGLNLDQDANNSENENSKGNSKLATNMIVINLGQLGDLTGSKLERGKISQDIENEANNKGLNKSDITNLRNKVSAVSKRLAAANTADIKNIKKAMASKSDVEKLEGLLKMGYDAVNKKVSNIASNGKDFLEKSLDTLTNNISKDLDMGGLKTGAHIESIKNTINDTTGNVIGVVNTMKDTLNRDVVTSLSKVAENLSSTGEKIASGLDNVSNNLSKTTSSLIENRGPSDDYNEKFIQVLDNMAKEHKEYADKSLDVIKNIPAKDFLKESSDREILLELLTGMKNHMEFERQTKQMNIIEYDRNSKILNRHLDKMGIELSEYVRGASSKLYNVDYKMNTFAKRIDDLESKTTEAEKKLYNNKEAIESLKNQIGSDTKKLLGDINIVGERYTILQNILTGEAKGNKDQRLKDILEKSAELFKSNYGSVNGPNLDKINEEIEKKVKDVFKNKANDIEELKRDYNIFVKEDYAEIKKALTGQKLWWTDQITNIQKNIEKSGNLNNNADIKLMQDQIVENQKKIEDIKEYTRMFETLKEGMTKMANKTSYKNMTLQDFGKIIGNLEDLSNLTNLQQQIKQNIAMDVDDKFSRFRDVTNMNSNDIIKLAENNKKYYENINERVKKIEFNFNQKSTDWDNYFSDLSNKHSISIRDKMVQDFNNVTNDARGKIIELTNSYNDHNRRIKDLEIAVGDKVSKDELENLLKEKNYLQTTEFTEVEAKRAEEFYKTQEIIKRINERQKKLDMILGENGSNLNTDFDDDTNPFSLLSRLRQITDVKDPKLINPLDPNIIDVINRVKKNEQNITSLSEKNNQIIELTKAQAADTNDLIKKLSALEATVRADRSSNNELQKINRENIRAVESKITDYKNIFDNHRRDLRSLESKLTTMEKEGHTEMRDIREYVNTKIANSALSKPMNSKDKDSFIGNINITEERLDRMLAEALQRRENGTDLPSVDLKNFKREINKSLNSFKYSTQGELERLTKALRNNEEITEFTAEAARATSNYIALLDGYNNKNLTELEARNLVARAEVLQEVVAAGLHKGKQLELKKLQLEKEALERAEEQESKIEKDLKDTREVITRSTGDSKQKAAVLTTQANTLNKQPSGGGGGSQKYKPPSNTGAIEEEKHSMDKAVESFYKRTADEYRKTPIPEEIKKTKEKMQDLADRMNYVEEGKNKRIKKEGDDNGNDYTTGGNKMNVEEADNSNRNEPGKIHTLADIESKPLKENASLIKTRNKYAMINPELAASMDSEAYRSLDEVINKKVLRTLVNGDKVYTAPTHAEKLERFEKNQDNFVFANIIANSQLSMAYKDVAIAKAREEKAIELSIRDRKLVTQLQNQIGSYYANNILSKDLKKKYNLDSNADKVKGLIDVRYNRDTIINNLIYKRSTDKNFPYEFDPKTADVNNFSGDKYRTVATKQSLTQTLKGLMGSKVQPSYHDNFDKKTNNLSLIPYDKFQEAVYNYLEEPLYGPESRFDANKFVNRNEVYYRPKDAIQRFESENRKARDVFLQKSLDDRTNYRVENKELLTTVPVWLKNTYDNLPVEHPYLTQQLRDNFKKNLAPRFLRDKGLVYKDATYDSNLLTFSFQKYLNDHHEDLKNNYDVKVRNDRLKALKYMNPAKHPMVEVRNQMTPKESIIDAILDLQFPGQLKDIYLDIKKQYKDPSSIVRESFYRDVAKDLDFSNPFELATMGPDPIVNFAKDLEELDYLNDIEAAKSYAKKMGDINQRASFITRNFLKNNLDIDEMPEFLGLEGEDAGREYRKDPALNRLAVYEGDTSQNINEAVKYNIDDEELPFIK